VLAGVGLPTEIPVDLPRERILQTMQVDKKKHTGKVRFALPVRIGEVKTDIVVDDLNLIFPEG
jgi:3-dehydroquinate synthetase